MTFEVRRSGAAKSDLIAIWVALAQHDEDAADRHLDRIEDAIAQLRAFPEIGTPRHDLAEGLRSLVRPPFMIFYLVDRSAERVDIVRVVDGRRDLGALFSA